MEGLCPTADPALTEEPIGRAWKQKAMQDPCCAHWVPTAIVPLLFRDDMQFASLRKSVLCLGARLEISDARTKLVRVNIASEGPLRWGLFVYCVFRSEAQLNREHLLSHSWHKCLGNPKGTLEWSTL